ncbi:hypothetical protein L195_g056074, partial [Trifolium pratense]
RQPMPYKDACIAINGGNRNEVVSVSLFYCRPIVKYDEIWWVLLLQLTAVKNMFAAAVAS